MGKSWRKAASICMMVSLILGMFQLPASKAAAAYTPGAWPTDFAPYTMSDGSNIYDPANEPGISPDDVDFTSGADKGIGNLPSFYVASDGQNLFFRMRLKGNPYDRKGGFLSSVWLVQLGVNGVHKATVGVFGKNPDSDFVYVAGPDAAKQEDVTQIYSTQPSDAVDPATGSKVPGTRILPADNGHYFLDFQVPVSAITAVASDIDPASTPVQLSFATSKAANLNVINKDGRDEAKDPFTGKKNITLNNVNPTLNTGTIAITNVDGKSGDVVYLNQTMPTVNGTSATSGSGYKIDLVVNGYTTTNTNAKSSWSIPIPSNAGLTAGGTYTVQARLYKQSSGSTTVVPEATDTQIIHIASDSQDTSTNVSIDAAGPGAMPTLQGITEAGDMVEIKQDGTTIATIVADTSSWSYTLEKPLQPGTYTFSAVAKDTSGNTATDTADPYTVSTGDLSISIDNGDSVVTTDRQPTIRGRTNASTSDTITVSINGGNIQYTKDDVAVEADGTWVMEYPLTGEPLLGDGDYTVTASMNGKSTSDTQTLIIDTSTFVNISVPENGLATPNTQPVIKGNTEGMDSEGLLSDVAVIIDGVMKACVQADANGNWSYVPEAPLTTGAHTVSAIAYDPNGNEATAGSSFKIVTVASLSVDGAHTLQIPADGETAITSDYHAMDQDGNVLAKDAVTWSVVGGSPAGVTLDPATGSLTVASEAMPGTITVQAVLKSDSTKSASVNVSLTAQQPEEGISGIQVTGETSLLIPAANGADTTAEYLAKDQSGSIIPDASVLWSVYRPGTTDAPAGVSIDAEGVLHVTSAATPDSTVRVVAALKDNPVISGDLDVTLTALPQEGISGIQVTGEPSLPIPAENDADTTAEYQAKDQLGSVIPDASVVWSVYRPGTSDAPAGVSIDSEGVLRVNSAATPDLTVRVVAALKDNPTVADDMDVTLSAPAAPPVEVANLDGWTGNQDRTGWAIPSYGQGDTIQLHAVSDESVAGVRAELTVNTSDGDKTLIADLLRDSTSNGQTGWQGTMRLPDRLLPGEYAVVFTTKDSQGEEAADRNNNRIGVLTSLKVNGIITDSNTGERIEGATVKLVDPVTDQQVATAQSTDASGAYEFTAVKANQYQQYRLIASKPGYSDSEVNFYAIPNDGDYNAAENAIMVNAEISRYQIELSASPSSIRGDGVSSTVLKAVIKDLDGKPAPAGIVVSFASPHGSFPNGSTAVTDASGTATLPFRSEALGGTASVKFPVTLSVNNEEYGLKASKQLWVTFEPGAVEGVVWETNGNGKAVVSGALVEVIQNDLGFYASQVTGEDGKYLIGVPEGDTDYQVWITKTVIVDGQPQKMTFRQTASVGAIANGETYSAKKTSSGLVQVKDSVHHTLMTPQQMFAGVKNFDRVEAVLIDKAHPDIEVPVALNADGTFNAPISADGQYDLVVRAVLNDPANPSASDQYLTISTSSLTVSDNGEMNIVSQLIDPYGTVRDSVTNEVIPGSKVTLYYANTARNIQKGIVPDTKVDLPAIAGFAPNDNASPLQLTNADGFYAYMVYPETDYYITVEKDGYVFYKSENLPVEWSVIQKNVWLDPIPSGGGVGAGTSVPAMDPKAVLNLSMDKNLVEEGQETAISIDYRNDSNQPLASATIKLTLPEGVEIVDAGKGKVDGSTVVWTLEGLASGSAGNFVVKAKWPQLNQSEASYPIHAELRYSLNGNEKIAAQADAVMKVFSNRYGELKHQRYILGYPDGQFKPARSLTRAELAAIIARLSGDAEVQTGTSYLDVAPDHWAADYIRIVTANGYFTGFADGTFLPDEAVTRGELATVMTRFLQLNVGKPGEWHFNDIEGHWAADAIEQLYRNKFVSGYPDGSFRPNDSIVRAEAVTLINRMLYRGPLQGLATVFSDVPVSHWAFGQIQEATQSHESNRNPDGSETWTATLTDNVR